MHPVDLEPMPYPSDPHDAQLRATLHPDDPLPAAVTSSTTTAGLQVLQVRVGPVLLELHDRAALYALEELVQLAQERASELWQECRGCEVRDSLVRDSWHDYCRELALSWPRPQLRPV